MVISLLAAASGAASNQMLPGAGGPRLQLLATPPQGLEIVDIFVYARPEEAAHSRADSVSDSGTSSDHVCTSHRSTWSVPSRRSEVSSWDMSPRRDTST